VVPLILLALPIVDALCVVLGRLSYRKPLLARRPDHLPHRLRARGGATGQIVAMLGIVQAALSGVALFVGRGIPEPLVGSAVAVALVSVPTFIALHGRVYQERRQGVSGLAILVVIGFGLLMGAASVPGVVAGLQARHALEQARDIAQAAI